MEEGEVSEAAPVLPSRPRLLLRAATQTKLNDEFRMGSRGPGTNEGDFLLMPHLAEIYPGRLGGWVCEPIAGYKCNRRASCTGGLRDLLITRTDTAGNGLPPFVASCARSGSRAPPGSAAMSHRGAVSPYLILSGLCCDPAPALAPGPLVLRRTGPLACDR